MIIVISVFVHCNVNSTNKMVIVINIFYFQHMVIIVKKIFYFSVSGYFKSSASCGIAK